MKYLKVLHNYFQNLFKRSDSSDTILPPVFIADNEKIARTIYSPMNLDKKNNLNTNAFKSPPVIDEVSVNRLNYTSASFLKKLGKYFQNNDDRIYYGFAILDASEIRSFTFDVFYSPKNEPVLNNYHSDIKTGYSRKRGEALPSELNDKIKELTKAARFYIDPSPKDKLWKGKDLI